MQRVLTKACKRLGVAYPASPTEYLVKLAKNKSITIFREKNGVIVEGRTFQMGDEAEYDSYNLHYTGMITKITDKMVVIQKSRGPNVKEHRLDLNQFCWRNFDFDSVKIRAENNETMMHI